MSLWIEASRDLEADRAALELTAAKVAVAPLWPFLASARSTGEFEHRLALAADRIATDVEPHLFEPVTASLRADFLLVVAADDGDGDDDSAEGGEEQDSGKPWEKSAGLEYFDASLGRWLAADDNPYMVNPIDAGAAAGAGAGAGAGMAGAAAPGSMQSGGGSGSNVPQGPDQAAAAASATNATPSAAGGDPWMSKTLSLDRGLQFFHAGLGRWVALDDDTNAGKGNPYYFTGGPEAGPETGETTQFPSFPAGPDPVDPLNQMFPMQPSPWTVPPGGEWKENPMQFSPPNGHAGSRHPFGERTAAEVGDTAQCRNCTQPMKRTGSGWIHTGRHGAEADDRCPGVPDAVTKHSAGGCPGHPGGHHRDASGKCVNCHAWSGAGPGEREDASLQGPPQKGADGSMYSQALYVGADGSVYSQAAGNPDYFAGGAEGVAGDQQSGFAPAPTEDPEDEWVDVYGAVPPQRSSGSGTTARHHATEQSPPPPGDALDGIQFSSPQERERWDKAQSGEDPGSRDIHAVGARHTFYDPRDRGVVMVAAGDPYAQSNNPYSAPANATSSPPPSPPPSMNQGGPGAEAMPPMTPASTPPRQMPGGAGGMGGGVGGSPSGQGDPNDPGPAKTGRRVHAEDTRGRRPDQYSTEIPDEYDSNTWDGGMNARPRQPAGQRGINTPQRPDGPIPTRSSSEMGSGTENEEGERRQAARIAQLFLRERELTGASR